MPYTHTPTYPIVDPDPNMDRVLKNLNIRDYATIAAFSGAGYIAGFFGASKVLRVRNGRFLSVIGLMAGLSFATMSSTQRLMGLEPNENEVRKYGVMPLEQQKKVLYNEANPNNELIDSSDPRK
eukprot:gene10086-13553_t